MFFLKRSVSRLMLVLGVAAILSIQGVSALPPESQAQDAAPAAYTATELDAMIDGAIERERQVIRGVNERTPMVETYIQHMKADPVLGEVPASDQHFLGRVEFGRISRDNSYGSIGDIGRSGFFKHSASYIAELGRSLHLSSPGGGFIQVLFMDANGFDRQHYDFRFVRTDFLYATRTAVFDVSPVAGIHSAGRFRGRIWVETRNNYVVRFNGNFEGEGSGARENDHLDSWRTNTQGELWLPASVYVESGDRHGLKFKATTQMWGYSLKLPEPESDVTIAGAADESGDVSDLSPLAAQREWSRQAENSVVDRLFEAGLIDAPSEFDKTLEALANNILVYNNIFLPSPIRCRVLLTQPLESLSVGSTIIISKSLLNTTGVGNADGEQQMGNLNAILAFQIAHIILGHRLDVKYAFNDRLLYPDSQFSHIPMHHTDADNEAAARKAIQLLGAKELVGSQRYFGLYLQELQKNVRNLKALSQPLIGDGLVKSGSDPTFWLAALMDKAGKPEGSGAGQQDAGSLSGFLRSDAGSDQVFVVRGRNDPVLVAANAMPFEIVPVFIPLSYRSSDTPVGDHRERNYQVVRIFFATDRLPAKDAHQQVTFTGERSDRDGLTFGTAEVSIPRDHRMGALERPSILRLEFREDPESHVVLLNTTSLDGDSFQSELARRLQNDPGQQALVFVHGYNVTFEEAARRLGQMTYDLGFAGAPILYSWPSKGSLLDYPSDEASVEWSSPHFMAFLRTLQANNNVKTIYIISHSMGNRLVASALATPEAGQPGSKVHEVIMAAPDIDAGVFQHLADPLRHSAEHITIYESSKDLALEMSHRFHQFSRLGDTDPKMHVFNNYECIEATSVSTGLINHSYVGDNVSILSDIFDIIRNGAPASQRFRLSQRTMDGLTYWAFKP